MKGKSRIAWGDNLFFRGKHQARQFEAVTCCLSVCGSRDRVTGSLSHVAEFSEESLAALAACSRNKRNYPVMAAR